MNQFYTSADHFALLPALLLALFGCAVLLLDLVLETSGQRRWLMYLTLAGIAATAAALFRQTTYIVGNGGHELTAFGGAIVIDRFALFFNWMFLTASAIIASVSFRFFEQDREPLGEYFGLVLLANCGMFFLATGADLIVIITGLELMAMCFYILVGYLRSDRKSNEAALKYLVLGGFSSGFLLYGFSLFYGMSGSTRLVEIGSAIANLGPTHPIVFMAIVASAVGLLFKISAVPFHMWAPDAYEGAPTPVTAYLAVASKTASFALLTRIFLGPLLSVRQSWEPLLLGIAILTLTVGNLAAISQQNIKRLLAYSSISHAGYILLALVAGNETGIHGIAVYLLVYTFMTMGAFLVVAAMRREGVPGDTIEDFRGLMRRRPGYALWMLLFLASLAGLPPTAGFIGKYFIFVSLIETGHYTAVVIAALYATVALYYYFRIVKVMFDVQDSDAPAPSMSLSFSSAMAVAGVLTVLIGIYPEPFLRFTRILPAPGQTIEAQR